MKAIVIGRYGAAREVFQYQDVPVPAPDPHEVLVRVKAASVNPVDVKTRQGAYDPAPAKPTVLGYDFAGVVERVGKSVTRAKAGQEICSTGANPEGKGGSYAEFVCVDENTLAPKPKSLSFEEAASLPLVAVTAWEALFDKLNVHAGEDVLIHAGAGGVGSIAIQLAVWKGAKVYTTVSSPRKEAVVKALGATPINYTATSFVEYAKRLNGGQGFSKIFDTVSGPVFLDSLKALAPYGHLVSILKPKAPVDLADAEFKNQSVHFTLMLLPLLLGLRDRLLHQARILEQVGALVEAGAVKPRVSKVFPLRDAAAAHEEWERGHMEGKLVLRVA